MNAVKVEPMELCAVNPRENSDKNPPQIEEILQNNTERAGIYSRIKHGLTYCTLFPRLKPEYQRSKCATVTWILFGIQILVFAATQIAVHARCGSVSDAYDASAACFSAYDNCHAQVNIDAQAGYGPKVAEGQVWRLFTLGLHNNDIFQLIGFWFEFIFLSLRFELAIGHAHYALFYFLSRTFASIFRYMVSIEKDFYQAQLGYSGGYFGMAATQLIFMTLFWNLFESRHQCQKRILFGFFIAMFLFEILDSILHLSQKAMDAMAGDGAFKVSHGAHFGGLLAGTLVFFAFSSFPKLETTLSPTIKGIRQSSILRVVCILGLLTVLIVGFIKIMSMQTFKEYTLDKPNFCQKS